MQLQAFRNSRGRPGGSQVTTATRTAEIDVKWTLHFRTLTWQQLQGGSTAGPAAAFVPLTAFSELLLKNAKVMCRPGSKGIDRKLLI